LKLERHIISRIAVTLMVAVAFVISGFSPVGFSLPRATAQEKPRTILDLFFPKERAEKKPAKRAAAQKPRKPKAKTKARKRIAAGAASTRGTTILNTLAVDAAPEETAAKLPNARKILVIGDFMATGLAKGLDETFAQSPNIVVIDAANGSSGLVRDDFYNWPVEIATLVTTHQPSAIVVMLGSNDRQSMTVNGNREAVRSPIWTTAYRSRANALATAVTGRQIPLFWVGQVPFRSSTMSTDMLALNDLFRDVASNQRAGATFIDVWEGFVDETGKFAERGPDINGQTVQLRSGQVNITKAGYRKIAFFAERELKRVLGDATSAPLAGGFGAGALPPMPPALPAVDANLERLRPVDLLAPASGSSELLGASVQPQVTPPALPQLR
jgi:uncharacterized protein